MVTTIPLLSPRTPLTCNEGAVVHVTGWAP